MVIDFRLPMTYPVYTKRLGLLRNPAVRRELARLDPERDYPRIVQLLTGYEFPFDITRALGLALRGSQVAGSF